jgi:hypothetical protein
VDSLSGRCPSLTFVVNKINVLANGDTAFSGGKCSDLSNGDSVDVTGTRDASGAIAATTVAITKNKKS